MRYVPPGPHKQSFTCPRCEVLAQQNWYHLLYDQEGRIVRISKWAHDISTKLNHPLSTIGSDSLNPFLTLVSKLPSDLSPVTESQNHLNIAFCQHCDRFTLWLGDAMIYPQTGGARPPHEDMPPQIRKLYEEARGVLPASPRASAALLRVALEGLLEEVGYRQGRLADRLKKAHEDGKLSASTYKLAETLRYAGNAAAHYEPWKIDPSQGEEDREMVRKLFEFVKEVTEELVAKPRRLEEMAREINGKFRKKNS